MSNEQQSGKMWSGRFREPLDPFFDNWQRSLRFDWQLLEQEIAASKAHALALRAASILSETELATIRQGLDSIWAQFLDPKLGGVAWIRDNPDAEDIHHFVELQLSARIGDLALKLHTGRSRNEQIATDLRLYIRSSINSLDRSTRASGASRCSRRRAPPEKQPYPPTPICNAPNQSSSPTGSWPTSRCSSATLRAFRTAQPA